MSSFQNRVPAGLCQVRKRRPAWVLALALALSCSWALAQDPAFLTNGLMAYYPFNGNVNDASGNGNTGITHGDPQPCADRFGAPNSAYRLNGAGDWISAAGSPTLNLTNDLTISLWANPTLWHFVSVLVAYSQEGNDQYSFDFLMGAIYFTYSNNGYNDTVDTSGVYWSEDVWHHACIVVRKTSNSVEFFRNGNLLSSVGVDFVGKPILPVEGAQLHIGVNPGENGFFSGMLDDIRIYNRALSSSEVAQLYAVEAPVNAGIIYVDGEATGQNNGRSWTDAFITLQGALKAATFGDSIWVAKGIYYPGTNRGDSFALPDGVQVYGGFLGTETDPSSRDPQAHRTVLSGDIGVPGEVSDNCYHVVLNTGIGSESVWDGFSITGGNADGSPPDDKGGGMYNDAAMPTIRHCTFEFNSGSERGGGMYNLSSSALVFNCTFRSNTAFAGAGLAESASSTAVIDCVFEENYAAYCAGVSMEDRCLSIYSGCMFRSNVAGDSGGAMSVQGGSAPQVVACTFQENIAEEGSAGAIWNWYDAFPVIDRCLFKGNLGGAIYNRRSSMSAANCIFADNVGWDDNPGGAINNTEASVAVVRNCTFVGNSSPHGKAIATEDWNSRRSRVELTNCILWDGPGEIWNGDGSDITVSYSDIWGGHGGTANLDQDPRFIAVEDFHLQAGSPCIDAGRELGASVVNDFDGRGRPADGNGDGVSAFDMGAYERGPDIGGAPVVTIQPQSRTNNIGTSVTFTVAATGTAPLAYRWQKLQTDWFDLPGCTDVRLVLTNVQISDASAYRAVVTNVEGAVTSAVATLIVGTSSGVWAPTGRMATPRYWHTATRLLNGKVLVTGGIPEQEWGAALASAELYDPGTGAWTPTGSMMSPRMRHIAVLLPNGKVLVAGGSAQNGLTTSAELYDPDTGVWTLTGNMNTQRFSPVATLIPQGPLSGMVLVAGGSPDCGGCRPEEARAELYDPMTGTWSFTGSMSAPKFFEDGSSLAASVPGGRVLVVGGTTCCPYWCFNEAESYDSQTQTWAPTAGKNTAANGYTVLLPNGQVLAAGGRIGTQWDQVLVAEAELFDSAAGSWTPTASMSTDRCGHTLSLLGNGQVLAAGGMSGGWGVCRKLSSAEIYDPSSGTWALTGSMNAARTFHTATLLSDGRVLVAGGWAHNDDCSGGSLSTSELYIPLEMIQMNRALNTPMVPWTTGGDAGWFPQQAVTHDGVAAAQSGTIGSGQQSWLSATVTGPGILTFWWRVSSEDGYDFLRFSFGGTEKAAISGETDWEMKSFKVPAGLQTLRWRYETDYSVSSGLDAGWLDEVSFVPFRLSSPMAQPNGALQFQISGAAPGTCTIEASTNLIDWTPLCTSVVPGDGTPNRIEVPTTDFRWRFFRAEQ